MQTLGYSTAMLQSQTTAGKIQEVHFLPFFIVTLYDIAGTHIVSQTSTPVVIKGKHCVCMSEGYSSLI